MKGWQMMNTDNCRLSGKFYRQIILLLAIVCFLTRPLVAQQGSDDVPKKPVGVKKAMAGDAPELTAKASQSIDMGLKYLLSIQQKTGSFSRVGKKGEAKYSVSVTSLALMAFMANAHFPGSGPYGDKLDIAKEMLTTDRAEAKAKAEAERLFAGIKAGK